MFRLTTIALVTFALGGSAVLSGDPVAAAIPAGGSGRSVARENRNYCIPKKRWRAVQGADYSLVRAINRQCQLFLAVVDPTSVLFWPPSNKQRTPSLLGATI